MLRYLDGRALTQFPALRASMHRDRADQFQRRLGWDVTVDARGWESDSYDRDDTLYVIWEMPDGSHGGSMRFLPTTTPIMTNDHFAGLLPSGPVVDPRIWECTRFCLSDGAPSRVAGALMLAGGELMRAHDLSYLLGVFDARMVRIYRMIGAAPKVLGSAGQGRAEISVGLWDFSPQAQARISARAGISPEQSRFWFDQSMGERRPRPWAKSA